jgi:hypothetical protein
MGCVRSAGCLVVFLVVLALGWFYRNDLARVLGRERPPAPGTAETGWRPLTPEGAARARAAIARVEHHSGRISEHVAPADLAAYVLQELAKRGIPANGDSAQASVTGDQLHVRAVMRLGEIGARDALGPFAATIGDHARVEFAGRVQVVRPGLGQYRLTMIRIGDLTVPKALIPRLVQRIDPRPRPAAIAPDGLPLAIPPDIGDVHVANGQVTISRAAR